MSFRELVEKVTPSDLSGWSVLDIGGYDGRYAGYAHERGAHPITIIDNEEWRRYGDWPEPPRPEWAEYRVTDVEHYSGAADLVYFGNVWYHMPDPLRGIRKVRSLTRRLLILCTRLAHEDDPVDATGWAWWPDGTGHQNGTVYCAPTVPAAIEALQTAGFREVTEIGRHTDHVVLTARS